MRTTRCTARRRPCRRPRPTRRRRDEEEIEMADHTVIQGGRVVAADGEYDADVLIQGEQIAAVGAVGTPDGASVIDASGCLLLPGLIDNHTHLSMPFMGMW